MWRAKSKPKVHVVYAIFDDRGEVMYIGSTSRFEGRQREHLSKRNTSQPRLRAWLNSLYYTPKFEVLQKFGSVQDLRAGELEYIAAVCPPLNCEGVPPIA